MNVQLHDGAPRNIAVDALDTIEDPSVGVVCLRRPPALSAVLEPWLAAQPEGAGEAWGWRGDPERLGEALPDLLRPLPDRARGPIGADLVELAPRFCRWTKRRHVSIRFESVASDGCRKFHVDYMALRLLVTYAGPGTEFVVDPHVDRRWLGRPTGDIAACNEHIVPDRRHVQRAEAGDILVMKGEHFPGAAGRATVHRSPPIEGTRARRFVMKIDVDNGGC